MAKERRYLTEGNNLSDLDSASAARGNIGLGNVDNTSDADKPVSTAQQAALDAKPDSAADIGLGNVDNTSDADKPVSTAQQAALDAKPDTAADIGLGNVDNTSDIDKPVSTAQQAAIDAAAASAGVSLSRPGLKDGPMTEHPSGLNGFASRNHAAIATAIDSRGRGICWGRPDSNAAPRHAPNAYGAMILAPLAAKPVKQVCAMFNAVLVLDANGEVWHSGTNGTGLAGDGTTTAKFGWTKVPGLSNIRSMHMSSTAWNSGTPYCFFINTSNQVYFLGNNNGQRAATSALANGNITTATQIPGVSYTWISTSGGSNTTQVTLALDTGGTVWGWGRNARGELGTGNTSEQLTRVNTGFTGNIEDIIAVNVQGTTYGANVCYIKQNGNLYAAGGGTLHSAFVGSGIQSGNQTTFALVGGNIAHMAVDISNDSRIGVAVVNTSGQAYVWGDNIRGQTGNGLSGDTNREASPYLISALGTNASKVFPGALTWFILANNGDLYSAGDSFMTGLGTTSNVTTFTKVLSGVEDIWTTGYRNADGAIIAKMTDGSWLVWGDDTYEMTAGDRSDGRPYHPMSFPLIGMLN